MAAEGEFGLRGVDRDQAGGGIAAAQRALRPAQDFDPVERAELAQRIARTRAVDPVDEHRDRAFEPGVVAHGADAADTRGAVGFIAGRGDQQRGRDLGQFADVVGARTLELFGGNRVDRDRDIGKHLRAALRGHDDHVGIHHIGVLDQIGIGLVLRHRGGRGERGARTEKGEHAQ